MSVPLLEIEKGGSLMFKIITFFITLLVGLGFAIVSSEILSFIEKDSVEIKNPIKTGPLCEASGTFQERVTVSMKRIVKERLENEVEFLISNNACDPVSYSGYSRDSLIYKIRYDGKEIEQFWCGTGMQEYELEPGGSLLVKIPVSLISNRGKTDSAYSVGFWLSSKEDSRLLWSNDFVLPKADLP